MSPITHLLASWTLADLAGLKGRDRKLVAWIGVAPDLDGLGVLVDFGNLALGRSEGFPWYGRFHHELLHGLPGALVLSAAFALLALRRRAVAGLALLAYHTHLLCDLVGSRGPDPSDLWSIPYLKPLLDYPEIEWSGQWALNAWPNVAFTVALMGYAFARAVRSGHSPVGLFGERADRAFVTTVRARWRAMRARGL